MPIFATGLAKGLSRLSRYFSTDVWVIRIIRKGPQHDVDRRSILTAATFVVRNRDDAVDVRKLLASVERVHVLARDPIAAFDSQRCSDRLSILQHELARRNRARREAMTRWHRSIDAHFASIRQGDFQASKRFSFDDGH